MLATVGIGVGIGLAFLGAYRHLVAVCNRTDVVVFLGFGPAGPTYAGELVRVLPMGIATFLLGLLT